MASRQFIVLATPDGICRFEIHPDGSLGVLEQTLQGTALEAVSQDASGILYAGSDTGSIYRSHNGGQDW